MIFDEEFRRRLEVLKRLVARALAGRGGGGRSPVRERGGRVEFGGHRAYAPGDDVRSVDWSAYARLETLVVKEFEAPRESFLLLVLDRSGSMALFDKDRTALQLAAALGWLGLAAGARVACTSRGGASAWIAGAERFAELLDALGRVPAGGAADLPEAVRRAPPRGAAGASGTAVVLSDLYEAEPAARALAALRRRTATVAVAHVVAEDELAAPAAPAVALRDAETGARRQVTLSAPVRAAFAREADAFVKEREALAAAHGARLQRVAPGRDLIEAVESLVA